MGRFSRITKPGGSGGGGGGTTEVEYVPTIVESTTGLAEAAESHIVGDVVGGELTLTSVFAEAGDFVKVVSVSLTDQGNSNPGLDVILLNAAATSALASGTPWELIDADIADVQAVVPIYASDWNLSMTPDTANSDFAEVNPQCVIKGVGTSLYATIVNRGSAFTPAAGDFDLTVRVEQY